MGFFTREQIGEPIPKRQSCYQCGLYKNCITPRMESTGKGEKGIFVLAEAPGKLEDEEGTQLIGKAGKLLRRKLNSLGIDLDRDCIKMNAVNCRPDRNRTPTSREISICRSKILREIEKFKPKLILLLGGPAVESVIGNVWKKDLGGITKWRGWTIPDRHYNCWICPTYHPSFVLREEKNPACELIFEQDLEKALRMLHAPFPEFKPIKDGIRIIEKLKPTEEYLKRLKSKKPEVISFDFETTGLKPHKKEHRIVTCSISTSEDSATAFLMGDQTVNLLIKMILKNEEIKKIGANIKFEHSWAREKLGVEVRGWIHDVCLAQHMMDNRQGICSAKFMAYIYLGIADYDNHISPFLKGDSKSGNAFNKINKIPIRDLLLYNGIDSKLEFTIAMKQMEEII